MESKLTEEELLPWFAYRYFSYDPASNDPIPDGLWFYHNSDRFMRVRLPINEREQAGFTLVLRINEALNLLVPFDYELGSGIQLDEFLSILDRASDFGICELFREQQFIGLRAQLKDFCDSSEYQKVRQIIKRIVGWTH